MLPNRIAVVLDGGRRASPSALACLECDPETFLGDGAPDRDHPTRI